MRLAHLMKTFVIVKLVMHMHSLLTRKTAIGCFRRENPWYRTKAKSEKYLASRPNVADVDGVEVISKLARVGGTRASMQWDLILVQRARVIQ